MKYLLIALMFVSYPAFGQEKKLKDTSSPCFVIRHPGELFDADRVNQAVMFANAIAVDSVKYIKKDTTVFINGKQYRWKADMSKVLIHLQIQ